MVSEVPGTSEGVLSVYSPNGTQLWNLTFGEDGAYWDSVIYARVSPDGRYLGVMTVRGFMLYREDGTLLWEKRNSLSDELWSAMPQWTSIEFSEDSRYVAFGLTDEKSVFQVFSVDGNPILNGTAEGVVQMKVSTGGVYLLTDSLFSVGEIGSKVLYYGFDGSNGGVEIPSGSPRGLDVLETSAGPYLAYADCGRGLSLIKNGTVVWSRDNGTCYWDVAFWDGKIYAGSDRGIAVYSLNGTLLDELGKGLSTPWTFLRGSEDLMALRVDLISEREETQVYLIRDGKLNSIWKVPGRYVGDHMSHAFADYRSGKLLVGVYGDEGKSDRVYLVQAGK
jgi:hypothetical protein